MPNRQVPRGDPDLKCPLWKKPMDQVCHTCPLWTKVRGKNPQDHEIIDRYDCSLAWLPLLLLENSQRQIQTAASVQGVADQIKKGGDKHYEAVAMMTQLANRIMDQPPAPPVLTNGRNEPKLLE